MASNKSGDGKSSPFGNGKGGVDMARAAPNNFVSNPGGGSSGGKVKPRNLVTDQRKPVSSGDPVNPDSVAPDGILPLVDSTDPNATHPLGKNSRKSFKLGS